MLKAEVPTKVRSGHGRDNATVLARLRRATGSHCHHATGAAPFHLSLSVHFQLETSFSDSTLTSRKLCWTRRLSLLPSSSVTSFRTLCEPCPAQRLPTSFPYSGKHPFLWVEDSWFLAPIHHNGDFPDFFFFLAWIKVENKWSENLRAIPRNSERSAYLRRKYQDSRSNTEKRGRHGKVQESKSGATNVLFRAGRAAVSQELEPSA